MPAETLPELDKECFFVAPIGPDGSDTRDRSDGVLEYIVSPAVQALGLIAVRADKIAKPGQITRQVIEHVVGAKAAVVDLTDANPNVYYEMAVRHTAQLPTVLIAQQGEKLPFDIAQMRTIFFDHRSLKSAAECRDQITHQLREALGGEVDSPIAASVTVQRLEQGTAQDRVLAHLVDGLDDVRLRLRHMDGRWARANREIPARAVRDVDRGFQMLLSAEETGDSAVIAEGIATVERGLDVILARGKYAPGEYSPTQALPLDAARETARGARYARETDSARAAARQADRDAEHASTANDP